MFSFFKKSNKDEFQPNKEMLKAAVLKGKRIGLKREEIIEMASLMDKKVSKQKIEKLVDKILS